MTVLYRAAQQFGGMFAVVLTHFPVTGTLSRSPHCLSFKLETALLGQTAFTDEEEGGGDNNSRGVLLSVHQ